MKKPALRYWKCSEELVCLISMASQHLTNCAYKVTLRRLLHKRRRGFRCLSGCKTMNSGCTFSPDGHGIKEAARKGSRWRRQRETMPLAGALDINYTCWNSCPTFCFPMCAQYNRCEEWGQRQEVENCKRKWSTCAVRTRNTGESVGASLA